MQNQNGRRKNALKELYGNSIRMQDKRKKVFSKNYSHSKIGVDNNLDEI
ncbi:MAG: hypothetical protein ACI9EW_000019 [Cellvibrionaceae bacterium]|jgi:hypothetical protein